MTGTHSITLFELITITLLLGAPVYITGAIAQGLAIFFLRFGMRRNFVRGILCISTTFVASVPLTMTFWALITMPSDGYFMFLDFIMTPALLAELVMIPFFLMLFGYLRRMNKFA
jgi:hypothetical protein